MGVSFEERAKLVRPEVDAFVVLVDQGHGGDIRRALEWITEG